MSTNLILISSANEGNKGISVQDFNGSNLVSNFKDCICDPGAMCLVGGLSSFSGQGSAGDYVVAAQSKKPIINVYQWGKPQVHFQCHVQEIVTAVASDPCGTYLLAGTKRGWIYIWEISSGKLLTSFQAHFKAVTHICSTLRGDLFLSASEDGMARCWDLCNIVGQLASSNANGKRNSSVQPFCSWNPHTLAVKGLHVLELGRSLRVITVSQDRNVVIYDVFARRLCHRIVMPEALESVVCTTTGDYAFVGASNGSIFVINMSLTAAAKHAPQASYSSTSNSTSSKLHASGLHGSISGSGRELESQLNSANNRMDGHTKAVVSLALTDDDTHLISGGDDACARVWDVRSLQCMHEIMQPRAISNVITMRIPEVTKNAAIGKPNTLPMAHLKKYTDSTKVSGVNGAHSSSTSGANEGMYTLASAIIGSTADGSAAQTRENSCVHRELLESRLGGSDPDSASKGDSDDDNDDDGSVDDDSKDVGAVEYGKQKQGSQSHTQAHVKAARRQRKRAIPPGDSEDFLSFGPSNITVLSQVKKGRK